ncbi:MAG: hypothetical protein MPN21_23240 [Thermoanaerobaculia bacterium]|nr:hypothetical protein [Thermoanaerobaculia bacterium]
MPGGLGASLLFPYFESDLNSFDGPATLISIGNGSAGPVLVRVVLWTDWGNPTLAFDVYLRGFSIQTLNLRDTLNGGIPSTGEGANLSAFSGCDVDPPSHSNPALTADEVAQLKADHTGQEGPLVNTCAGSVHTDGIARGYITVDVVDECSGIEGFDPKITPANAGLPYFADGDSSGVGINSNSLWGDIFYLSTDSASAHGSTAVSLWADATKFSGDDVNTFYGRHSNWDGRDNRVPLPSAWNQRFINGGPFAGGADVILYQDTGVGPRFAACGSTPDEFPLAGHIAVVRDSGEDTLVLNSDFADLGGLAAQRGSIGSLPIPYAFGWTQIGSFGSGAPQYWVQPTLSAAGLYSASLHGVPVNFLCDMVPPAFRTTSSEKSYNGRPGITAD